MTRPYFLYQAFRYLIDTPILLVSFFIARYYTAGYHNNEHQAYSYIILLFSIVSWYGSAQVSRLYTDLRTNKFSEEIIYILITLLIFAILFTSFLFFIRNNLQLSNYFLIIYFSVLFTLI